MIVYRTRLGLCTVLAAIATASASVLSSPVQASAAVDKLQSTTFSQPGSFTYTVPVGATALYISARGAAGGSAYGLNAGQGGLGAQAVGLIRVDSATTPQLLVEVGAAGAPGSTSPSNAIGAGGQGAATTTGLATPANPEANGGGGGGGYSSVSTPSGLQLLLGGGGGGGGAGAQGAFSSQISGGNGTNGGTPNSVSPHSGTSLAGDNATPYQGGGGGGGGIVGGTAGTGNESDPCEAPQTCPVYAATGGGGGSSYANPAYLMGSAKYSVGTTGQSGEVVITPTYSLTGEIYSFEKANSLNLTNGTTTYTVSPGVTAVMVRAAGAAGASGANGFARGGKGALVRARLAVTAGDVLSIQVGTPGQVGQDGGPALGGNPGGGSSAGYGTRAGGGGGFSGVSLNGKAAVVAGGGGGGGGGSGDGSNPSSGVHIKPGSVVFPGGNGGKPEGADGGGGTYNGKSATGGSGGASTRQSGASSNGGTGRETLGLSGGGGGGGWVGGGGGHGGGGGGGSSYVDPTAALNSVFKVTTKAAFVEIIPVEFTDLQGRFVDFPSEIPAQVATHFSVKLGALSSHRLRRGSVGEVPTSRAHRKARLIRLVVSAPGAGSCKTRLVVSSGGCSLTFSTPGRTSVTAKITGLNRAITLRKSILVTQG